MGSKAELQRLMGERVVVLDGAWGTMLQQSGLAPSDYRTARFADPRDVGGRSDPHDLLMSLGHHGRVDP